MSSVMHTVLNTELTTIPGSVRHILGDNNFNNALCNGVTWLLVAWLISYCCYEKLIHVYLKQMGFNQYLRSQLSNCLWLLTVYLSFVAYYLFTTNDYGFFYLMNFKRVIAGQYGSVPYQKALVHAIICSFYLHRVYVEGIRLNSLHYFATYLAITAVCILAYILRFLEIPCTLTVLVAVPGMLKELTKITYLLLKGGGKFPSLVIKSLYISTVVVFCSVYFIIIPLAFLIPLGMKLFSGTANFIFLILFVSLLVWLNMVIYKSILLNLMFHWLYHLKQTHGEDEEDEEQKPSIELDCNGKIIACSLFPPRTDDGYMMAYLRLELKKRQKKKLSQRKPKNRTMIIQTLKCMMFIKRKLNEKKSEQRNNGDSDESEEKPGQEDYDGNDEIDKKKFSEVKKRQTILNFATDNSRSQHENDRHDDDNDDDDNEELEINNENIEDQELKEENAEKQQVTCSSNMAKQRSIDGLKGDDLNSDNKKACGSVAGGNGFNH